MFRPFHPFLVLAAIASAAAAQTAYQTESRPEPKESVAKTAPSSDMRAAGRARILSAREVEEDIEPYVGAVSDCFKRIVLGKNHKASEVRLEIVVAPTGRIHRLRVVAPGVSGKRFSICVEKALADLWFRQKPGYSTITVPFLFVNTTAPGAGPLLSCWKRKGCPEGKTK
jgi:hypothetical protein